MGLSDRFKSEKKVDKKEKNKKNIENKSEYPSHVQADLDMLEDIECMVLNKIAYTPVWFEFSDIEQRKLIKKYLNARLELPENAALVLTEADKEAFVNKILTSV